MVRDVAPTSGSRSSEPLSSHFLSYFLFERKRPAQCSFEGLTKNRAQFISLYISFHLVQLPYIGHIYKFHYDCCGCSGKRVRCGAGIECSRPTRSTGRKIPSRRVQSIFRCFNLHPLGGDQSPKVLSRSHKKGRVDRP